MNEGRKGGRKKEEKENKKRKKPGRQGALTPLFNS